MTRIVSSSMTLLVLLLTFDAQFAGGLGAAQLVHRLAAVVAGVGADGVGDGERGERVLVRHVVACAPPQLFVVLVPRDASDRIARTHLALEARARRRHDDPVRQRADHLRSAAHYTQTHRTSTTRNRKVGSVATQLPYAIMTHIVVW